MGMEVSVGDNREATEPRGDVPSPAEAEFAALYRARFSDLAGQLARHLVDFREGEQR